MLIKGKYTTAQVYTTKNVEQRLKIMLHHRFRHSVISR